jgi:Uma2 family endonuclease
MIAEQTPAAFRDGIPRYAGVRMTKAEFLNWESDDNYIYEFNAGVLEPKKGMRQDENYLLTNLENKFFQTRFFQQGGRLRAEMDTDLTDEQTRRPDVSFFTSEQIRQMNTGQPVIPSFVVEFSSATDNEWKSILKRHEYFDAGVQVLWWVYPSVKEVHLYTSPKAVTICTGDDVLQASPVLPDLQLTVNELFTR